MNLTAAEARGAIHPEHGRAAPKVKPRAAGHVTPLRRAAWRSRSAPSSVVTRAAGHRHRRRGRSTPTALVAMFGAERALPPPPAWSAASAARFLKLDHTAIFLMIAGTSTPDRAARDRAAPSARRARARVDDRGRPGSCSSGSRCARRAGTSPPCTSRSGGSACSGSSGLWESTGVEGVLLVAGGGVLYTIGAVVHAARRPDPWPLVFGFHEIFHAFVIAAALLHWSRSSSSSCHSAHDRRRHGAARAHNRGFWDADADDYQATHGALLDGASRGVGRVAHPRGRGRRAR